MSALPIFLRLSGRSCLVVGGGDPAAAKARLLLKADAAVTVVAPQIGAEIAALAADGRLKAARRAFVPADVAGHALVFGATGRPGVDEKVAEAARAAAVPVNIVDGPALSSFVMPAIVDRDPVMIGISSDGAAPALVRRLRGKLESELPARLGPLARFARKFRGAVRANFPDPADRRRFWERFFDGPIAEAVLRGDERAACERMLASVNRRPCPGDRMGQVHLVGAGPGDPDLLTLRALRVLQQADVVVHDQLIGPGILDYARRDAERIYVGKSKAHHGMGQARINALLARLARAGKRVVRLKGGDPFVFGRGGEELAHLLDAGVPVEVVPGITAAVGCAAFAGIPLTHRDCATAVTFISGHGKDGAPIVDWDMLARGRQTLVVYMGLTTIGAIARQLIGHGMDPATPAAIVENGTLPQQRLVTGCIAELERLVAAHALSGPAIIIVGDVVRHADAATSHEPCRTSAS